MKPRPVSRLLGTRHRRAAASVLLAASSLLLVSACSRLPDELQKAASVTKRRLDAGEEAISEKQQRLAARLQSDQFAYLQPYAEQERWQEAFGEAGQELARARALFDGEAAPLLDKNEAEDAEQLAQVLVRVDKTLTKLSEVLAGPAARADQLADAKENAPSHVADAQERLATLQATRAKLEARGDEASADYPEKADDLTGRLAALRERAESVEQAVEAAAAQLPEYERGGADLARLADSLAAADQALESADAEVKDLDQRMTELYASYAKTLVDMKAVYTVLIGRTSWNEYSDFPTEHEYKYGAREVDPETLEALDAVGEGALFSGRTPRVSREVWEKLRLNPVERMPPGDNAVELWLSSVEERYFHRYEYVEGAERRQGDWEEVDEALFEAHADDLGMDIVAKPYGMYEDEALRQAMPPGMAFVGNPRYGRWEDDGQGGRRWSWIQSYLFYRLLFGGNHYYHYGGWNTWRGGYRGRSPYYGGVDGGRSRYGTGGSLTQGSSRYAGSAFATRGGFKRAAKSYRGAGPGGRGGGPGGRGK